MGQGKLDIYLIDTVFFGKENFIGECSVKVGGKQSSMSSWDISPGLIAITRRGFGSH